jgi:hypothetical protein
LSKENWVENRRGGQNLVLNNREYWKRALNRYDCSVSSNRGCPAYISVVGDHAYEKVGHYDGCPTILQVKAEWFEDST